MPKNGPLSSEADRLIKLAFQRGYTKSRCFWEEVFCCQMPAGPWGQDDGDCCMCTQVNPEHGTIADALEEGPALQGSSVRSKWAATRYRSYHCGNFSAALGSPPACISKDPVNEA